MDVRIINPRATSSFPQAMRKHADAARISAEFLRLVAQKNLNET
jgi:transposase